MTDLIQIIDVAPRDGLQSQPVLLDTEKKLGLISRLIAAGIKRIEVASFVNPEKVPQMADAELLISSLPKREDVSYIGLVLNMRGFERALATGIDEINCVVIASETFNQRNQGASIENTMQVIAQIAEQCQSAFLRMGVTIGAAFACPFEGAVPLSVIKDIVARLVDMGVEEIALADTIGAAIPSEVTQRVNAIREINKKVNVRCHFHNTRNTAIANAYAAIMAGVRILDASCGGTGGCPFAPNASGNVATEDLLYMLGRMKIETGIDIQKVMETTHWLEGALEAELPAMVTRAGLFPDWEKTL